MGRIKRGGYIFVRWIVDHEPFHVHVYKDDRHVAKVQLDPVIFLEGQINIRIYKIIKELIEEGKL